MITRTDVQKILILLSKALSVTVIAIFVLLFLYFISEGPRIHTESIFKIGQTYQITESEHPDFKTELTVEKITNLGISGTITIYIPKDYQNPKISRSFHYQGQRDDLCMFNIEYEKDGIVILDTWKTCMQVDETTVLVGNTIRMVRSKS